MLGRLLSEALVDDEQTADKARFFANPASPREAVRPGAQGDHCRNIQLALMRLGFDENFRHLPLSDRFTADVSAELKRFQAARSHTSVDGLCGPGTRKILVAALTEQVHGQDIDPFTRMVDPEHRANGLAFLSYARADRPHVERFAKAIQQWGYHAWYDASISGGEKFSDTLMERIKGAYLVLVFETPAAVQSRWVRKEVEYAAKQSVRILPIEIAEVGKKHPLSKVLSNHHRLGASPIDLTAPAAADYRAALRQALREAHQTHAASR